MISFHHPWGIGAIVVAAVGGMPQPISLQQDFHVAEACDSYREMLSSTHPIVMALSRGEIYAGMSRDDLLVYGAPLTASSEKCYTSYGYVEPRSFDYVSISMVHNRVTSATSGSCTWDWKFFNETPEEIRTSVNHIRDARHYIHAQLVSPRYARFIEQRIDEELVKLAECCQKANSTPHDAKP